MADVLYNSYFVNQMNGNIDLDTDDIAVALVTSDYTPDINTHESFDDITNEVTGDGYTAGGETIANTTVTKDNTDNAGVFEGDNVSWTDSTITAAGAILYKRTGTATTSWLIGYLDFDGDQSSNVGTFEIQWDSNGIIRSKQEIV